MAMTQYGIILPQRAVVIHRNWVLSHCRYQPYNRHNLDLHPHKCCFSSYCSEGLRNGYCYRLHSCRSFHFSPSSRLPCALLLWSKWCPLTIRRFNNMPHLSTSKQSNDKFYAYCRSDNFKRNRQCICRSTKSIHFFTQPHYHNLSYPIINWWKCMSLCRCRLRQSCHLCGRPRVHLGLR